jgi:hypothetical protein
LNSFRPLVKFLGRKIDPLQGLSPHRTQNVTLPLLLFNSEGVNVLRLGLDWLLLRGGLIQSVPCDRDHFSSVVRSHLSSNHFRFIYQRSLVVAETPSSDAGSLRKSLWILLTKYLCHNPQGSSTSCNDMWPTALLLLRINLCYRFVSHLKIHRSRRVWTREPWVQWQAR